MAQARQSVRPAGMRRDLKKEAFWRRAIDRQAGSGLSARAWCRGQGLSEAAFYWWRRELTRRATEGEARKRDGAAPKKGGSRGWPLTGLSGHDAGREWARRDQGRRPSAGRNPEKQATPFVAVRVAEDKAMAGDSRIEIVLAGERRVRVMGRVDGRMLAEVLEVLTAASSPRSRSWAAPTVEWERGAC